MPELPEVEVVASTIRKEVVHKVLIDSTCYLNRIVVSQKSQEEESAQQSSNNPFNCLKGQKLLSCLRRAKYLIFCFERQEVVVHLGMTGQFLYYDGRHTVRDMPLYRQKRSMFANEDKPQAMETDPHVRFVWRWCDASQKFSSPKRQVHTLYFRDVRALGKAFVLAPHENHNNMPRLIKLGLEPLSSTFSDFENKFFPIKTIMPIKSYLLSQKFLAGLGNIYADETLFKAGCLPSRKANTLTKKEWKKIFNSSQDVLQLAIKNYGTTLSHGHISTYFQNIDATMGTNQNVLQVYGRSGKNCFQCSSSLQSIKIAGRTTVWCKQCQT